jgi:hypothetical protein
MGGSAAYRIGDALGERRVRDKLAPLMRWAIGYTRNIRHEDRFF